MNAIGLLDQEEWLFLSRTNLKKLHAMHVEMQSSCTSVRKEEEEVVMEKVEREHFSFLSRYHSSLLKTMESVGNADFRDDCKWLKSVLKCLPMASEDGDGEVPV